ncbi:MAG: extracellular solute-binding protein [Ruminococcaceae bacterium]|nr:extracellular solute-binding protein [Oscillospiraceae bacterium]
MKKAITLLLLAAMLTSVISCGGTETPSGDTSSSDDTTTEAPVETDIFEGLDTTAYEGRTFNWMIPDLDVYQGDLWVDESTGEVYDDAIHQRNSLVQDRFGITINPIIEPYTWAIRDQYTGKIRTSVQSGDNAYDLVACHSYLLPQLALEDLLLNLNDVNALRLDQSHWSQLVYDALTYKDKVFFMSGDISVNILEFANVLFMNKKLLNEYNLEAPYELAKAGKWTQDKLEAMIKDTSRDVNGDSVMDGNDMWGYIFHDASSIHNISVSFDIPLSKHEGDTIVFNLDSEDAAFAAEYTKSFLIDNPDTHPASSKTGGSGKEIFMAGRAIFYAHQLHTVESLREMEDDFGIMPFPKYDEAQKDYITSVRDSFMGYCIPSDTKDAEFVGTIMEALCVSGSEYVIPAYYDVVLKGKTARDEESAEMLDIIKGSLDVNFAYAYSQMLGSISNIYVEVYQKNIDLASHWASKKTSVETKLADLLTKLS